MATSQPVSSSLLERYEATARLPIQYGVPRQVWVENMDTVEEEKLGMIELNPDVFAVYPRIDFIHANMVWQQNYKKVKYNHVKNRYEMVHRYGGGGKPWPQKGTGRARHGSIRGPQWIHGGKAHGPRNPRTLFYMLDYHRRVYGLTHTLSAKFVQDDVHVVNNLDIPTDDSSYLADLIKTRNWSMSTLFVDVTDEMPRNIVAASDNIPWVNLMPVYGLNVLSMLKHHTLVLTEAAVKDITQKLLFALNRTDKSGKNSQSNFGWRQNHDPEMGRLKMETFRPVV